MSSFLDFSEFYSWTRQPEGTWPLVHTLAPSFLLTLALSSTMRGLICMCVDTPAYRYKCHPRPHTQVSLGHSLGLGVSYSLAWPSLLSGWKAQGSSLLWFWKWAQGHFWQGILGSRYEKNGVEGEMQAVGNHVPLAPGKPCSMRRDMVRRAQGSSSPSLKV